MKPNSLYNQLKQAQKELDSAQKTMKKNPTMENISLRNLALTKLATIKSKIANENKPDKGGLEPYYIPSNVINKHNI